MSIKTFFNTLLAAAAATLIMATPAQATLQARDLSGDGVTDAFYDTDLNITWLRNANVNGRMTWADANTWANGYSFGGYDDWRLPSALNADGTRPCAGLNCTRSEMGHLWYLELLNTYGNLPQYGNFLNMRTTTGIYWSGTETLDPNGAWLFDTRSGNQTATLTYNYNQFNAMVVRPGDVLVAQVPEPGTLVLAAAALVGLGVVRRRRALGASAL